ncbi:MAG TPA: glucoamylase family protein [Longimicrobiales bacterium]|nr:glucoamylase family protein [Longimicrobiales bacterium]
MDAVRPAPIRRGTISRLLRGLSRRQAPVAGPIRGELLGADQLAERARTIAASQQLVVRRPRRRGTPLLHRLKETRGILAEAHARLAAAAAEGHEVGPGGEWLLDNYHVVQEHIREVHESLPGGYYRELPELASGRLAGYPRMYELAIALISHTEGRLDLENVGLFVRAFQSEAPLLIGELWAVPTMLRLGLIENVRRMALRSMQRLGSIEEADRWAAEIERASEQGVPALEAAIDAFRRTPPPLTPVFISRFLHQIHQTKGFFPPLVRLEEWIVERGRMSVETAEARATQYVALTQLMMANSITSLRAVGHMNWKDFVEGQSLLEAVLQRDPARVYGRMTFATRDHYRHVVERISKRTGVPEGRVAGAAIDLARSGDGAARTHVGYWLVDEGIAEFERVTGYRPRLSEALHRLVLRHPEAVFGGGILGGAALSLMIVVWLAGPEGRTSPLAVLLLALLPAIDIGLSAVNQLVTAFLPPRVLSKLDLVENGGIPAELRTAVVTPTLFGSVADVEEALDRVEVQFLANREANLHFAILSDFVDAPTETQPGDDAIVTAAVAGVRELNARHAAGGEDAFYLLHRPRRWNAQQGVWMGWERKRGKLAEFNRFLRGAAPDAFKAVAGDVERLRDVCYVITLDADTVLPPGAAPLLIGALAHPLNRAVYDARRGRVVRGYGILQPRVGVSLPSAHRSHFAAIHSGHPGVDPYTTAISDVYQDLFGEGSYTGKGIYDVDVFEQATHGRFPENSLLSHDLIEGSYARAGLATEIAVYDDYPSRYLTFTRRKHRWIRGDWQLLPWLRRRVPGPDGPEPNRLSLLSRWKILDNLRRSTVEIAQLLFLVAGWTILPGSPLRWTILGLLAVAAPWIISLLLALIRPPLDKSWRAYYSAVWRDALTSAQQVGLAITFLPHQAWISADAIVRTLRRLFVTHRLLLEWQTASVVEQSVSRSGRHLWRSMWPALALVWAVIAATLLGGRSGESPAVLLVAMLPLAALWTASPAIANALAAPAVQRERRLPPDRHEEARRYALLHWRFFERFVVEETNWLVPDNFQEDPSAVVALRTSPTNIGLQLLSTVSAFDLGFIDAEEMTRRLELAFRSLDRMERFRGHFYNWYDLSTLRVLVPAYTSTVDSGNLAGHLVALRQACLALAEDARVESHGDDAPLGPRLRALAERTQAFVADMDFGFLFDETRELFSIGFSHETHSLDPSYYDLLASESRLASFIAIAKKDVPYDHWFRLGRTLTRAADATALISWSGSVFEYLMPSLVMRAIPFTLLAQACNGAVRRHVAYGRERGVPWGVSESAFNLRDRHLTYQYRAFGVPDLALKRGLGRDLVIAPYASALAMAVDAQVALANLAALERRGALGEYGFREALDYTRPDPEQRYAIVGAYMAHHIGMSLVALTNALERDIWQVRFHADPVVRSAELLLHERIPRRLVLQETQVARADEALPSPEMERPAVREYSEVDTPQPRVALLGRLPYTIMLSHAGGGYSRYEDLAVTRWRADATRDATGQFCYVKDVTRGRVWSAAHQPVCAPADSYRAILATDRVAFHRTDGPIETRTEIAIVPEDSAEVRRVTLVNNGNEACEVELTSYGEIVLAPPDSERAHPAFANLFVETEWHEWCTALTATRRPRSAKERSLWCVHVVDSGRDRVGGVTCETNRARFIGRGRSTRAPIALEADGPLSGTTGAVLDPIFALRTRVRLEARQTASVAFTTLVATTRVRAFELADRYHEPHSAQRALELAWASEQIELRELNVSPADAALYQELAGHLFYASVRLRAPQQERMGNLGSQPLLWSQGISGDWPIVLASIDRPAGMPTLRELFAAHRYWRRRGMTVDLVVINEQPATYLQEVHDGILEAMYASSDLAVDQPGGVFIRRRDLLRGDELLMLRATARLLVRCDGRELASLLATPPTDADAGHEAPAYPPAPLRVAAAPTAAVASVSGAPSPASPGPAVGPAEDEAMPLLFDNGYGGLAPNGDYHVRVREDALPPAPWANVIANENGGFLVSERGTGFTWAGSSYFYRLTPWHNDPVADPPGEAIYLRDEETGDFWCPTPAPLRSARAGESTDAQLAGAYTVRHGAGSSSFDHRYAGIESTLTLGMAEHDPVKISLLRLTNREARPRRIALTAYVEWTLGVMREHTQHQVLTRFSDELSAILARNTFAEEFAGCVAFCALSEPATGHTADRREFLGRNGSMADPAGLYVSRLARRTGAGLDPCAALQCVVDLAPGETREIAMLLGASDGESDAHRLIARYRAPDAARAGLERSVAAWFDRLTVVSVRTPEPSFDALLNRWTLYQALACRMWARSALYQSSGAYGFRDQLQDVMAFVYAEPALARAHILRAASRQFVEGDVQHWWHPHSGRGVRTRFSDDLVWLAYVTDHYVRVTGDASVLDETVPFLRMRPLEPHEHEVYDLPGVAAEEAPLHEHCLRALRRACTAGAHGLPLIGTGDWNDGMNLVGAEGRGESVWLAWFLITTLRAFAEHVQVRGDEQTAGELRARADDYARAVEDHGWDGEWYRRAYFDDGTPLGSAQNEECRIDSIAQSWSVISGAGDPARRMRAMRSLEEHLVREDARLLPLLTPPFDDSPVDPGYIKGYLPGVRENGAQYTHAALWAVLATALGGDGERAFELFQMINPLTHACTPEAVETYKVEPYVVAADVYTAEGQLGRGGWTWYTGSASWMYRVGLEAILGFTKRGAALRIEPRVPASWPEYSIEYRFGGAVYSIVVNEPARAARSGAEVTLDGRPLDGAWIPLMDDGARHEVIVRPRRG